MWEFLAWTEPGRFIVGMDSKEPEKSYFPVFMDLAGTRTACLGEGHEIENRVQRLLECGATVYHVTLSQEGSTRMQRHDPGPIPEAAYQNPDFRNLHWIRDMRLVIVEPGYLVNQQHWTGDELLEACNKNNTLLCVLDRKKYCNYISPAVLAKGPFQIAISSSGVSPSLSVYMKERIKEDLLTEEMAQLAYFFKKYRPMVSERIPGLQDRRAFYISALQTDLADHLAESEEKAVERFQHLLESYLNKK